MLSTTTTVSRPPADRQYLDLQNAESATAWIMSFVAKCQTEKKEDKVNTDGTIMDLKVTISFLVCAGKRQDEIIKLRSLMSPRHSVQTSDRRFKIIFLKRVVTAERAEFLSVIQGVGESNDELLARLREEARYEIKTPANPEEEKVKIKFISGLRDPEAKRRLLDGIKAKSAMSVTAMTESLQFRSHAMAFASSSSGNKPFTVKEQVGYNFKKNFRKPNKKLGLFKAIICALGVELSHILVDPVQH